MQKYRLKNGMTVLYEPRSSDSVAIEVSVGTGSNNEPRRVAGISHFLEHMVFEGSTTRSAREISEAVENVGGELNAATSNERTFFYIKIPKNKLLIGLDILSDILGNPAFRRQSLEKERKVILEEIKMVIDQPIIYQWVFFEESIFKRHPTKYPVYGTFDSVRSISRRDMLEYHRRWYVPNNMTLSVVGDVKNLRKLADRYFGSWKRKTLPKVREVREPEDRKPTVKRKRRDTNQAYLVIGYKTVSRKDKDSFVLDVISAIFSKGLSGRINDEIRVKRGLAYSVGTVHECKKGFGFFVVYLNCDKGNVERCKRIILDEFGRLDSISAKELREAKEHLVGKALLDKENSQRRADELAFWEFVGDAKMADGCLKRVRSVTRKDILRVRDRFLKDNYTMIVISK